MINYEIKQNIEYHGYEIYFEGKPAEEVRNALKALRFRWHSIKKCWYGRATESEIIKTINEATPEEEQTETTIFTEGYFGMPGIHGGKSHKYLYGQDLKKAIADDIKKAGIKGITLAMKHGNLQATIKTTTEDLKTFEEFEKEFRIKAGSWIYYFNENGKIQNIYGEKYFYNLTEEEQKDIRTKAARFEYYKEAETETTLNHYYLDDYKAFTEIGMKKINKICRIIEAYRYDESNSMVDYFDTNFYYDIITKPSKYRKLEG